LLAEPDGFGAPLSGAIFSQNTSGAFIPVYSPGGVPDGGNAIGWLIQGSDGKLYGTTALGCNDNLGTVFVISTNGEFTSLASFDHARGAFPSNGLIQTADGSLCGTASTGGTNGGWGTVFRLTADGTLTALHSFDYQDGAATIGGLVQGTDGNLYGADSHAFYATLGWRWRFFPSGRWPVATESPADNAQPDAMKKKVVHETRSRPVRTSIS
jgi:uncharacterized repeat protein (TIGR03803 family)